MASLPSADQAAHSPSKQTEYLKAALDDLFELHRLAHQLRADPETDTEADFSARELDALIAELSKSYQRLALRVSEVCSLPPTRNFLRGLEARARATRDRNASSRLIITYKRCSRLLFLASEESRAAKDTRTWSIVQSILSTVEKQFWTFNTPPEFPAFCLSATHLSRTG